MRAEQVIAAVRFDPLLPVWMLVGLAVVALLVVGLGLWRRGRGTLLRLAAFAVLLLWLTGPRLVQETRQSLKDIGLLVVDQTASMQVGDRAHLADVARQSIEAQAAHVPDLELRTITVPEGGNVGTRLFGDVDRALADIPRSRLAGTIAITDGQIHDVPSAAPGGAPLNLLLTGHGEETDRRLRVIEAPGYGIVGKSVTLRVAVDDLGTAGSGHTGPATLTVRRDGQPFLTESVAVGVEQRIDVPITRSGPSVIEMSASPLAGEVSQLNNRAVVEINGVRDRLRVLLISGEPHPGERTWRRLLKADPSVDLVHFTILRPPEKDDRTPLNELALIAFPVRELFVDKIGEFDLIILDRFQNRGLLPLPYLANIANRVRQGGALLMSVGPEFTGATSLASTPLGAVLPGGPARGNAVVDGRFQPWVSDLGQRHPVTEGLIGANPPDEPAAQASRPGTTGQPTTAQGSSAPGSAKAAVPAAAKGPDWGSWYRRIEPGPVNGEVLLRTPDGAPLLALDRVGQGRTALLLSDQIWLWSRGHEGGGPQAELLRRIAHWLMQEPDLEENALTARVADGRLLIERRSTDPASPGQVVVIDPEGKTDTVELHEDRPGRATASRTATVPGVWRVSQGQRSAYAAAGAANPPELADLRATASVAGGLARASGGGAHWLAASDRVEVPELRRTEEGSAASGSAWIGLERRHDHVVTGVAALELLPGWLSLPVMVGLLLLAWRREGR